MAKPRNDRNNAVTKFCLAMEDHRRTEVGRVRTAREFVANFFPYDDSQATDKLFNLMPNDVRGPVLSHWGIRGGKAALKDDDEKVRNVVHDALVAGDIDETIFEEGVTSQILVDWVALGDWWTFWRQGKLTGIAIQKALATARELELIDDRWFFNNVQGRGGKLKGTDVVCDTLSKDQIVAWMRKVHESGDGSPAGLVAALGWDTVLAKTAQDALLFALDQFARKAALVPDTPQEAGKVPESKRDVGGPTSVKGSDEKAPDSGGMPVAIPELAAVDSADDSTQAGTTENVWATSGESPKLVEARAKMMEMLGTEGGAPAAPGEGWATTSEAPEKPSSLEWGTASEEPKAAPPPLPKKPAPTPRR